MLVRLKRKVPSFLVGLWGPREDHYLPKDSIIDLGPLERERRSVSIFRRVRCHPVRANGTIYLVEHEAIKGAYVPVRTPKQRKFAKAAGFRA